MKRIRSLLLVSLFFALSPAAFAQQSDPLASDYFTVKQIVPGVWALIVKQRTPSVARMMAG